MHSKAIKECFFVILILSSFFGHAQDLGQPAMNGFKNIILGSPIDSVQGEIKLKKKFEEQGASVELYSIRHPEYEQIGEIPVIDIELKTYRNIIYQIQVITEKDSRLMKAMEGRYGKATFDGINSIYFWKFPEFILKFSTYSKNKILLVYTSYTILNKMKMDKSKKVEDIADDF